MTATLVNEAQLAQQARRLADDFSKGVIHLYGELGTGKTTFCQYFIASYLPKVLVTSPTYAIVQEYSTKSLTIYHIDLYRLNHPHEARQLALAQMISANSILLIEWPSNGGDAVPSADIEIELLHNDYHHRHLKIQHRSI